MADTFIGEIEIMANNYCPRGWYFCDGGLVDISEQTALFAIIGTIYGGDGRTKFALPDLQARAPMGPGQSPGLTNRRLGEYGGLPVSELEEEHVPEHTHDVYANLERAQKQTPDATSLYAIGFNPDGSSVKTYHIPDGNMVAMAEQTVSNGGESQAHENRQPLLVLQFCITWDGVFPSRN